MDNKIKVISSNDFDDLINARFKYWDVDDVGNVSMKSGDYAIIAEQLTKTNWLDHILRKNWDPDVLVEFYPAYRQALINAGYKSITIDLIEPNYISGEK